jgi:hypothetical protein
VSARRAIALIAALSLAPLPAAAQSGYAPPEHKKPMPDVLRRSSRDDLAAAADQGIQIEQDRRVADILARQEQIAKIGATLAPQRPGIVDAYIVSAALDSDGVFGREAREAARVLERRYDAAGRSIVLAGSDGSKPSDLAIGSPESLATALARVSRVMDRQEDVLVLFTTSHGMPGAIVYHDGDSGYGGISPGRLAAMLDELGIRRRLLVISACYSGVFADRLAGADTAVLTAASASRTSFGCAAGNDWTFFGDAFINHALRRHQSLEAAFTEAGTTIAGWENQGGIEASLPQIRVGDAARAWLASLDARVPPQPGTPVGRPATEMTEQ